MPDNTTDILRAAIDALADHRRAESIAILEALIGELHADRQMPTVCVAIAHSFYGKEHGHTTEAT